MNRVIAPALRATAVYEFRMAARRKMLWLAILPLLALSAFTIVVSPINSGLSSPTAKLGTWAVIVNVLVTVGIGVAMADRFVRVHRLGLAELLMSTPVTLGARLLGILAGSLAAALAPVAALMVGAGVLVAVTSRDPFAPGWALIAFGTVILPGALLLTVLSATAGLVFPVPVARVLVVVFWFWANLLATKLVPLPTPTGTLLSPLGDYAAAGWLRSSPVWAGRGSPHPLSPTANGATAALSIAALVLMTALVFVIARTISARRA